MSCDGSCGVAAHWQWRAEVEQRARQRVDQQYAEVAELLHECQRRLRALGQSAPTHIDHGQFVDGQQQVISTFGT
jgi:hypothetical protein